MKSRQQCLANAGYTLMLLLAAGSAAAAPASTATTSSQETTFMKDNTNSDTKQQVAAAKNVVEKLEADPEIKAILDKAKGVFIIPSYARGGWGIGIRGGEGVMLVNKNGQWSSPVFYNYGGVSIGAQAGAEIGSVAMFLMNDKAVSEFSKENNFSLTAGAGLTIANYTANAGGATGNGDVIVWSDTKGAFANATVGITDIHFDDGDNREFYGVQVSAKDIISGKVGGNRAPTLKEAISAQAAKDPQWSSSSGGPGTARRSGASGSSDSATSSAHEESSKSK